MADTGFRFANRTRPTWMNQYFATSGNVPSASFLDEIIQNELEAAANKRAQMAALQLQKDRDDYQRTHDADVLAYQKQHDSDLLNYNKGRDADLLNYRNSSDTTASNLADTAAKRARTNALITGGAGLVGTAAGLWGKSGKSETNGQSGGIVSDIMNYFSPIETPVPISNKDYSMNDYDYGDTSGDFYSDWSEPKYSTSGSDYSDSWLSEAWNG